MLLWYLLAVFVIFLLAGVGLMVAMSFALCKTLSTEEGVRQSASHQPVGNTTSAAEAPPRLRHFKYF